MNIVLYPQKFNKRGDANLHSVFGVTHDGRSINVKLRVAEQNNSASIAVLDSYPDHNTHACQAIETNSPDSPHGAILFTQCRKEVTRKTKGSVDSYIAGYAVQLNRDTTTAAPIVGLGRIDIPAGSQRYVDLYDKKANAKSAKQKDFFDRQLKKLPRLAFPAILYDYQDIKSFDITEESNIRDYAKKAIQNTQKLGAIGGFAVRLSTFGNEIKAGSYIEIFQEYLPQDYRFTEPKLTVDNFFESDLGQSILATKHYRIDIVPLKKLPSTRETIQHFLQPKNYRTLRSIYTKDDYKPKLCPMVVKLSKYSNPQEDINERLVLVRAYSIASSLGSPEKLHSDGTTRLSMVGERHTINPNNKLIQVVGKTLLEPKRNTALFLDAIGANDTSSPSLIDTINNTSAAEETAVETKNKNSEPKSGSEPNIAHEAQASENSDNSNSTEKTVLTTKDVEDLINDETTNEDTDNAQTQTEVEEATTETLFLEDITIDEKADSVDDDLLSDLDTATIDDNMTPPIDEGTTELEVTPKTIEPETTLATPAGTEKLEEETKKAMSASLPPTTPNEPEQKIPSVGMAKFLQRYKK